MQGVVSDVERRKNYSKTVGGRVGEDERETAFCISGEKVMDVGNAWCPVLKKWQICDIQKCTLAACPYRK